MGSARLIKILRVAFISCFPTVLAVYAAVNWYVGQEDASLKPTSAKIANMTDEANLVLEAKNAVPLYPLPDDLRAALRTPSDFQVHHKVGDIPESVRMAFAQIVPENAFSMAEPGARWSSTDVGIPGLPHRRLKAEASGATFCLVFYEHGGIGRSNDVAVFRFSPSGVKTVWHAYIDGGVADPASLSAAIDSDRVDLIGAAFF
jgi:hypothetical protein